MCVNNLQKSLDFFFGKAAPGNGFFVVVQIPHEFSDEFAKQKLVSRKALNGLREKTQNSKCIFLKCLEILSVLVDDFVGICSKIYVGNVVVEIFILDHFQKDVSDGKWVEVTFEDFPQKKFFVNLVDDFDIREDFETFSEQAAWQFIVVIGHQVIFDALCQRFNVFVLAVHKLLNNFSRSHRRNPEEQKFDEFVLEDDFMMKAYFGFSFSG